MIVMIRKRTIRHGFRLNDIENKIFLDDFKKSGKSDKSEYIRDKLFDKQSIFDEKANKQFDKILKKILDKDIYEKMR